MPAMELQRLWTRLTADQEAAPRKKSRAAAASVAATSLRSK
jgi:hypothetical protein